MAFVSRSFGLVFRRFQSNATHIPAYKTGTSSAGGGNQVPANQKFFQMGGIGDKLVHLRGSNDQVIYRGLLTYSLIGIGLTFYSIARMANGTIPRKERST